jgi:hypothetical protein
MRVFINNASEEMEQKNNDFVMPEVDEMMDYVAKERQKAQVSKTISLNSTLPTALNKCPGVWIDAMCTQFGLFEKGKKPEKIQRIVEYLTDAKRLASVVGALPEDSKNALGFVTKQNGWVEIEQLEACGSILADGWFWADEPPQTPLGRLRVRALLFVGRAIIDGEDYTVAVIPKELREPLKDIFANSQ